jgi:hypothetical protein
MRSDKEGIWSIRMLKWSEVIEKVGFGCCLASHEEKSENGEGDTFPLQVGGRKIGF